jgi:hypothetical protein
VTEGAVIRYAADLIASLAPGAMPVTFRVPLAEDESRWFIRAVEVGLVTFRECPPDCFRLKKWAVAGPDHFDTPVGKHRHLYSTPAGDQAWLNREYVPHIAAYARAVEDYQYSASGASFSRYRRYTRDLITKKAGGSYETDVEFSDLTGAISLQVEAKRDPAEIERMAHALDHAADSSELPVRIVKEIEYVMDLAPRVLWLVAPGTVDPARHVFRVEVSGRQARFSRIPDDTPGEVATTIPSIVSRPPRPASAAPPDRGRSLVRVNSAGPLLLSSSRHAPAATSMTLVGCSITSTSTSSG